MLKLITLAIRVVPGFILLLNRTIERVCLKTDGNIHCDVLHMLWLNQCLSRGISSETMNPCIPPKKSQIEKGTVQFHKSNFFCDRKYKHAVV